MTKGLTQILMKHFIKEDIKVFKNTPAADELKKLELDAFVNYIGEEPQHDGQIHYQLSFYGNKVIFCLFAKNMYQK